MTVRMGTQLGNISRKIHGTVQITFDKAVNDRVLEARIMLDEYAKQHPKSDHLQGIFLRTGTSVLKCAGLIAMSEGRSEIVLTDLLIALRSMEHWAENIVTLAEAVIDTDWRKNVVDKVLDTIARAKNGIPETGTNGILSSLPELRRFELNEALERLELEGRIRKEENKWVALG